MNGVLAGIRVINLAANLPGPAAAQRLCRMGADVVKVEAPSGDPMETYHAGWYRDMMEGQTVVTLDIKSDDGKAELDRLLGSADLLISASRPAAMKRLGLDWESLSGKYPRLCQVAIIGFLSPRENEAGHDLTYQASLGLLTPPHMPRTLLADMAGAEQTLSSALALLLQKERTGVAGYAEVALSEAAAALAEPLRYGCTSAGANLGGGIPEYNIYRSADGWVAVAALEPHFKSRLEGELSIASFEEYQAAFAGKSSAYWQEWGEKMDVPIETVQ
ncbi:MAG TPA: CoA transferase [Desulfuromonadales bacterium]|nr:CoA transferase [Desulfuromonadales bacterium]